jgi:L-alanine-DL-glutamate epimerase-like enolase superfamily enzyme
MRLSFKRIDLKLRHTFRISRGAEDVAPVVITTLEHEGVEGFGEASPSSRYGETIDTVLDFLGRFSLGGFSDPFELEEITEYLDNITFGNAAAKAAVDIALHDWVGKKLGQPLYRILGLRKLKAPMTSFTIGIDSPEVIAKKIAEAEEYPILKIKLGTNHEKEIMAAVRRVTKKPIRVDANEGWKTKELALERVKWLEQEGVEFVEQPMPATDNAGCIWLREHVSLPLIADESCVRLKDVPKLREGFDGINIKLMKCGGLREAMRMIHTAKALGMKTMLGCMIESSVAITAAAHLSPLVDYADLDGNLLVTNDPFCGVKVERGQLILNDEPGLGLMPRD